MSDSDVPKLVIDHIAIAVEDVDRAAATFGIVFDGTFAPTQAIPEHGVRVAFAHSHGPSIELVEGTTAQSVQMPLLPNPVRSFIARHGQGLHHICLRVQSLDAELARLDREGIGTVPGAMQTGAAGGRVAFLNPAHTNGVLIELVEVAV